RFEHAAEPASPLLQVAVEVPEPAERAGEPEPHLCPLPVLSSDGSAGKQTPIERDPEVVVFPLEQCQPLRLVAAIDATRYLLGQRGAPRQMPAAHGRFLAGLLEP